MASTPEISAIVCTHNREGFLGACIESLLVQSLDLDRYEIIVVDNASADDTRHICSKYEKIDNFKYIYEPTPGLSQARNSGWKEARGRYIGFIDDDAQADKRWLEKALESFAVVPEPDWVGGPVTLVWERTPPAWLNESYYSALGWVNWGGSPCFLNSDSQWLVGCNSLFRRKTLEQLGGFDTRLGRRNKLLLSGEEVQLHHKIKAAGGHFYYHPGVRVDHHVSVERTTPDYFYRRYYWGGITDYIMARTLHGIPSQIVSADDAGGSRLARLSGNLLRSIGLFVDAEAKVQSRIYMSYVAGQLAALLKYGWRQVEAGR
jgi:glycosyltransferase involved in cell wall biosynthesis